MRWPAAGPRPSWPPRSACSSTPTTFEFVKNGRPEHVARVGGGVAAAPRRRQIDLFQLHRVDPETPLEETWGAMASLVERGWVRALGLSETTVEQCALAHAIHPVTSVQSEFSLWTREPLADVLPWCAENGASLRPLRAARPRLPHRRRSTPGSAFEDKDFRAGNPRFAAEALAANQALVDEVRAVADSLGRHPRPGVPGLAARAVAGGRADPGDAAGRARPGERGGGDPRAAGRRPQAPGRHAGAGGLPLLNLRRSAGGARVDGDLVEGHRIAAARTRSTGGQRLAAPVVHECQFVQTRLPARPSAGPTGPARQGRARDRGPSRSPGTRGASGRGARRGARGRRARPAPPVGWSGRWWGCPTSDASLRSVRCRRTARRAGSATSTSRRRLRGFARSGRGLPRSWFSACPELNPLPGARGSPRTGSGRLGEPGVLLSDPRAGHLLDALGAAAADCGLDRPVDRALQRRRKEDLLPAELLLQRGRRRPPRRRSASRPA